MSELAQIRERMERLGLTQAQLGAELGFGAAQVSHLLTGRRRMRLDVYRQIDAVLKRMEAKLGRTQRGVAEDSTSLYVAHAPVRSLTLDEARALKNAPPIKVSKAESARIHRELKELGETLRRSPRVSDMTDDEILGYDETP